ncbi:MAG TPA: M50 family metallopeptidase [Trueperaceae bacterium]
MLTALIFLLILTVSVSVHELAHYLNARSVGVPVRAFSIGMGPAIWKRRWAGTEWRVGPFPVGGYVDLPGMAPKVDEEGNLQHPDEGMATKSLPQKLWVLVGGVIANFALGVLLIALALTLEPSYRALTSGAVDEQATYIEGVMVGSAAEALGLQAGDRIVLLNGVADPSIEQVVEMVQTGDRLEIVVVREGERLTLERPWPPEGTAGIPQLGVTLRPFQMEPVGFPAALGESFMFSVRAVPQAVVSFVRGFGSVLTGNPSEDVAGPVGMVSAVNQAAQVGVAPVLMLAALINLSLAVFNLLPIPGLDGGRMLLATLVAIRRRPFRPGQEETIHFIGVMAVLALILLITFNELGGIIRG